MSKRQAELLNNCFGYLSELISNESELKRVLTNTIGMTKQELEDYGFCFHYPNLNSMCFECTRLGKDCDGSTNSVWTGCIFKETHKKEVDYAAKFRQLLELSDNLKTGHFDEVDTEITDRGFLLFSMVASLKVEFNPETTEWRVRIYCEDFSVPDEFSNEKVNLGRGWSELIQYLCVDSDTTWFMMLTKEQVQALKEEH